MLWGVREHFFIVTIGALMLNGIHTCIKMYVNKKEVKPFKVTATR